MSVLRIMAGQNLGKRLLKEIQRGGKKSLVLGLLLLVGLGFWAPMLWRKLFPKRETPTSAASASKTSPKPDSVGQQTAAPVTSIPTSIEWKSLHRRLEKSSMIQPLALDEFEEVRDPFEQEWIREKKKPLVTKPDSEIPKDTDPLRALILSAVLAGRESSAAVINDVVYTIGQEVPKKGPIRYVLKEIHQDRIVLEHDGKFEELRIQDSEISNKESSELSTKESTDQER